ncbi:MAG: hypothetical protein E7269_03575 [Lachnospiraceae bacterium]|nr:hypothetical protein [Lachnospiraceae bacterium]
MKAFGLCLIFTASCGVGFRMSRLISLRYEELKILKRIMIMLRGEVNHNHATLWEAFATIGRRMEGVFAEWLLYLSDLLKEKSGQTMATLFETSINEKLKGKANLQKKDLERLCQLGENLGYLDREMQLSTVDFYLEQLEQDKEELAGHLSEQKKLYPCLGIVSGLFFVLLLI